MRRIVFAAWSLVVASSLGCTAIAGLGDVTDIDCADANGCAEMDATNEETTNEAAADTARDSAIDARVETSIDAAPESAIDSGIDSGVDSALDAVVDTADTNVDDTFDASDAFDAADTADTIVADSIPADTIVADTSDSAVSPDVSDSGSDTGVCPIGATPLVAITDSTAAYSIEATEVTRGQYAAFLVAKGSDVSGQPATCGWNTTFVPVGWTAPTGGTDCNVPVTNVDWCDAAAYCSWAGRRLCGQIGGGVLAPGAFANDTKSEWFHVCSNAGSSNFTYGNAYVAGDCVDSTIGVPKAVGTDATCHGTSAPFSSVFDLNGNVFEWASACNSGSSDGSTDSCQAVGGSYLDKDACNFNFHPKRNSAAANVGIRCCGG